MKCNETSCFRGFVISADDTTITKYKTKGKTLKNQNLRQLYSILIIKKHNNIDFFLLSIKNHKNFFWECCRDVTEETLLVNKKWNWLGSRVDDFAHIVELDVIRKLEKWRRSGSFAIVCNRNSLEDVVNWLFERYISMLKNLFDTRYKNSLDFSFHIDMDDFEHNTMEYRLDNDIYLDEFLYFSDSTKIKIIQKLWEDNIFDLDFELEDLRCLCEKYQAPPPETFLKIENVTKYEVKRNESGNSQLVFSF